MYRRLKAHGLSDACLELHSNKANRKTVIAQLGAAWDRSTTANKAEWVRLSRSLSVKQDELNLYVSELHEPGTHGRSVFDGIGILSGKAAKFSLEFSGVESHDRESFNSMIEIVERLALIYPSVRDCESLECIEKTEWSFAWQNQLLDAASRFRDDAAALRSSCEHLGEMLGLPADHEIQITRLSALRRLSKAIENVSGSDFRFIADGNLKDIPESLQSLKDTIESYVAAGKSLTAKYDDAQIQRMSLHEMDLEWRKVCAKMWPLSAIGKRRVQKLLQGYASDGKADPACDIQSLIEMQEALSAASQSPASKMPDFRGVHSDVSELVGVVKRACELHSASAQVDQDTRSSASVLPKLKQVLPKASESSVLAVAARDLIDLYTAFNRSGKQFMGHSGGKVTAASLQALIDSMRGLKEQTAQLNNWVKWSQVKQEAQRRGLSTVVEALSSGVIDDPVDDFLVAYSHGGSHWQSTKSQCSGALFTGSRKTELRSSGRLFKPSKISPRSKCDMPCRVICPLEMGWRGSLN